MTWPDLRRLVLVTWTARDGGACVGTGYFVTARLVLTASHVVPDDLDTPIDVRVEMGQPRWRKNGRMKWRDKTLDAALIQVGEPLPADVVPVKWGESLP